MAKPHHIRNLPAGLVAICPAHCAESKKNPTRLMVHCDICDKKLCCAKCALTDILGSKCSNSYTQTVIEALRKSKMWIPVCEPCYDDDGEDTNSAQTVKINALSEQLETVQQQISELTDNFTAISDSLQDSARTPAPKLTSYASIVRTGKLGLPVPPPDRSLFDKAQTELVRVQDWEREVSERHKRELNIVINRLADNDTTPNETKERVNDLFSDLQIDNGKISNVRSFTTKVTKQVKVIVELKDLETKKLIMTRKRAVLTEKRQYSDTFIGSDLTPWQGKTAFDLRTELAKRVREGDPDWFINYSTLTLRRKRQVRESHD